MREANPIPGGEIAVYQAADGAVRVEVRLERDTIWLTQVQMAKLFGRERSVITKHVRNLFREGELDPKSVCAKFAHTAADGKTYQVEAFNLEVIISVGALHHADGTPRLSDGALVALTLMIAESRAGEKDILVRILMHLLLGEEMA